MTNAADWGRVAREPIEVLAEAWAENDRLKAENRRLREELEQISSAAATLARAGR